MSEQLTFHRGGTNPDTSLEADRPKAEVGAARAATDHDASYLRVFVFALFFFFGGITSLNDVIIPKLKELFTLSYAEVMTVQSALFGAYFIISLPAAAVVRRIGYMRSAVVGISMTAARRSLGTISWSTHSRARAACFGNRADAKCMPILPRGAS
jgi:hypothetical protein